MNSSRSNREDDRGGAVAAAHSDDNASKEALLFRRHLVFRYLGADRLGLTLRSVHDRRGCTPARAIKTALITSNGACPAISRYACARVAECSREEDPRRSGGSSCGGSSVKCVAGRSEMIKRKLTKDRGEKRQNAECWEIIFNYEIGKLKLQTRRERRRKFWRSRKSLGRPPFSSFSIAVGYYFGIWPCYLSARPLAI